MLTRRPDRVCDRAYQSLFCFASPGERRELGLAARERGPLFAGFASALDEPALNRVLGLGRAPDSLELLMAAVDWLRVHEVRRALLPVAEGATGARAGAWLLDKGLTLWGLQARLSVSLGLVSHPAFPDRPAALDVKRIPGSDRNAHAGLLRTRLGLSAPAAAFLADTHAASGWIHFGAYDGNGLAASASLFIEGAGCALMFAAIPSGRADIADALMGACLRAAREAGCEEAWAEYPEAAGEGIPLEGLAAWGFATLARETVYLYKEPRGLAAMQKKALPDREGFARPITGGAT